MPFWSERDTRNFKISQPAFVYAFVDKFEVSANSPIPYRVLQSSSALMEISQNWNKAIQKSSWILKETS